MLVAEIFMCIMKMKIETQQIHSQSEHVLCLIDKWDCTVGEATQWNQAIDKIFLDNVAWHCHN